MDNTLPNIVAGSNRYWLEIDRHERGDELVGHISDLKECDAAVYYRRKGVKAAPFSAETLRMFQMGHIVEDVEATAIARGLQKDGWKLERGVLTWIAPSLPEWSAYDLPVEAIPALESTQHDDASGLYGGRLPRWWYACDECSHEHDDDQCLHVYDDKTYCGCKAIAPRTALAPKTILVGHTDYVLTKAWVSVVVETKSKGIVAIKDVAEPRFDYVLQARGYGFCIGARQVATYQVARDSGEVFAHFHDVAPYLGEIAQLVRSRVAIVDLTAPPANPNPPHKWYCQKGKNGKPYCGYYACPKNAFYQPGLSEDD